MDEEVDIEKLRAELRRLGQLPRVKDAEKDGGAEAGAGTGAEGAAGAPAAMAVEETGGGKKAGDVKEKTVGWAREESGAEERHVEKPKAGTGVGAGAEEEGEDGFLDGLLEKITVRQAGFGAALFFLTLVWGYFLNASGIVPSGFLRIAQAMESIAMLTSADFILFLLVFPLCYALAAVMCRGAEKGDVRKVVLLPSAVAGIIALLALGNFLMNIIEFAVLGLFYLASLFLLIEISFTKFGELEKYVMLRTANSSASTALHVLAVGLFVVCVIPAASNPEMYAEEFEELVMTTIAGETGATFAEMSAELVVETKKQTLAEVMTSEGYLRLQVKTEDAEAQGFVGMMEAQAEYVESPEYKEMVTELLLGRLEQLQGEEVEIGELVKSRLPGFEAFMDYIWLAQSVFVVLIFLTVANIVLKPLAIVYALVLGKVVPGPEQEAEGAEGE